LGGAYGSFARARGRNKPNVVLLYADDLGYGDLSCYGSRIATPNIDRMAAEGVRFTDFCSASSVCSPARAGLMTGRYPVRAGVTSVLGPGDSGGISPTEITLAEQLRGAGYRTACVGKWHLGAEAGYMPLDRGFDEFFGLPYSHDMWPRPLMRNRDVIESPANVENLMRSFTEAASAFISSNRENPFFLYVPFTAPHIPLSVAKRFRGTVPGGLYGATLRELDWSVGEILRTIREAGVDENTLVLFSSDNGPWYQGSSGPLRGRKRETWEGGIRVPLIARMPGRIPGGTVQENFASALDLFPTIANLTGAGRPSNPLDGSDIWNLLTGYGSEQTRELFLYFDFHNVQCARLGAWKLHVARYNAPLWAPRPEKGIANLPLRPELYHMPTDPKESYDVADENPEIVADIRARIENALQSMPDYVRHGYYDTLARKTEWIPSGALPIERVQ
jgi:arylsulfatase A-like enzyme